jgi:type I protein arginine methyltransferase
MVHGVASWFDVLFDGSISQRWLSTAPGLPTTHWFQLRMVLERPLEVAVAGTVLEGELHLKAHSRQSYDVRLELRAPAVVSGGEHGSGSIHSYGEAQVATGSFDLKEPYYRQLVTGAWQYQQGEVGGEGTEGVGGAGGEVAVAAAPDEGSGLDHV